MDYILGSGMSGLVCANYFKGYVVLERASSLAENHKALFRFRSDLLSETLNIKPFRKIEVRKSIYCDGKFYSEPDIVLSILYSKKVSGFISNRSIWSSGSGCVERYIPDYNLIEDLALNINIEYKKDVSFIKDGKIFFGNGDFVEYNTIISTIPLVNLLKITNIIYKGKFGSKNIFTNIVYLRNCSIDHTIYVVCEKDFIYRISFVKDKIIFESVAPIDMDSINRFLKILHIDECFIVSVDCNNFVHVHGKMFDTDSADIKSLLLFLTEKFNIYSAGRYAIWKNIMTEDLLSDLSRIKELMYCNKQKNRYNLKLMEVADES